MKGMGRPPGPAPCRFCTEEPGEGNHNDYMRHQRTGKPACAKAKKAWRLYTNESRIRARKGSKS